MRIISEINRRKSNNVVIKSDFDAVIEVINISGILANDADEVINAIAHCNLMATSVGENAIEKFFPIIARGMHSGQ